MAEYSAMTANDTHTLMATHPGHEPSRNQAQTQIPPISPAVTSD
jgi:hypothetical protein